MSNTSNTVSALSLKASGLYKIVFLNWRVPSFEEPQKA